VTAEPVDPPIYGECVIGYRQWHLTEWVLNPVGYMTAPPWRPGVNTARCAAGSGPSSYTITFGALNAFEEGVVPIPDHMAPGNQCRCGLYAYHDPIKTLSGVGYVWGAVAAWGNIEVHHNGFRAQYAQIVALTEPESREEAENLRWTAREIYKVPVVPYDQLVAEAERHGRSLPVDARPPKPETKDDGVIWIGGGGAVTWPGVTYTGAAGSWLSGSYQVSGAGYQVAPDPPKSRTQKKPRKPTPKAVEKARRKAMRQSMTKPQRAPKNL
jgi:hypothetical protein